MITENVSTLKINKLSKRQYDRELAAGRIDDTAIYLVPDEESSGAQAEGALTDLKGYYFSAIDLNNKKIYLSETKDKLPIIVNNSNNAYDEYIITDLVSGPIDPVLGRAISYGKAEIGLPYYIPEEDREYFDFTGEYGDYFGLVAAGKHGADYSHSGYGGNLSLTVNHPNYDYVTVTFDEHLERVKIRCRDAYICHTSELLDGDTFDVDPLLGKAFVNGTARVMMGTEETEATFENSSVNTDGSFNVYWFDNDLTAAVLFVVSSDFTEIESRYSTEGYFYAEVPRTTDDKYYDESFETPAYNQIIEKTIINLDDKWVSISETLGRAIANGSVDVSAYMLFEPGDMLEDEWFEEDRLLHLDECTDNGEEYVVWYTDGGDNEIFFSLSYTYDRIRFNSEISIWLSATKYFTISETTYGEFCIINGDNYSAFGGKIIDIDHNKITYSGDLPFTTISEDNSPQNHIFYVPEKYRIGSVVIENDDCIVQGKYNLPTVAARVTGAGTDDNNRSNIEELDWNGNFWVAGDITFGPNRTSVSSLGSGGGELISIADIDDICGSSIGVLTADEIVLISIDDIDNICN